MTWSLFHCAGLVNEATSRLVINLKTARALGLTIPPSLQHPVGKVVGGHGAPDDACVPGGIRGRGEGHESGAIRDVDLTVRLAAALEAWQAAQEADALVSGKDPSPWVFPEGAGILDSDGASRRFRAALRRAGLPRFRLYDLRHTWASHLLAEGAPLPYVAAQLGHAKPTTTLAHYAHFLPRGDRAWADRLEAARSADSARLNARASKVATSRQTV